MASTVILYPTTFRYNAANECKCSMSFRFYIPLRSDITLKFFLPLVSIHVLYIPLRSHITLKTISQLGRTKCLYIPLRSDITTESLFVVDVKRVFISHYVQI